MDSLGRVVIPKRIRDDLGIQAQDQLAFSVRGEKIALAPVLTSCVVCNGKASRTFKGRPLCNECRRAIVSEGRDRTGIEVETAHTAD